MKKPITTLATMFLFAGLTITGCKNSSDKIEDAKQDVVEAKENQQEAQQDLNDAKADSVSEYSRLKAETNAMIADNQTRIAEFRVKAKTESAGNRAKFQQKIDKLEARNNELEKDINDYKDEGKEKWEAFRMKVENNVNDIKKDINDYKKEHNY